LFLAGALGGLLLGCGQPPGVPGGGAATAGPSTEESAAFVERMQAASAEARARATAAAATPPTLWPAPQPSPGGMRIDMRGRPDHVHRLEKQPDGTWRQICRSTARPLTAGSGQ
jgi:hypothetical protein